jgi:GWxTD domain-containing protein
LYLLLLAAVPSTAQYSLQSYVFCSGEQPYLEIYTKLPAQRLAGHSVSRELFITSGLDTIYGDIAIADLGEGDQDFFDVHRVQIASGQYDIHVTISGSGILETPMRTSAEVSDCNGRLLSDIVVAEAVSTCQDCPNSKYDRIIEPRPGHVVIDSSFKTLLYVEAYKTDSLIKYLSFGVKASDGRDIVKSYKALTDDPLQVLVLAIDEPLASFDQSSVYVAAHDALKQTLYTSSTSVAFTNYMDDYDDEMMSLSVFDTLDLEDLRFDLKSLIPIVGSVEGEVIARIVFDAKTRYMRNYLKRYWRDNHGAAAVEQYLSYKRVAEAVHDRFYNTVGYGFETDRGYIYLKYGKPNDLVAVEDEPDAPPYQIWRYNYISATQQTDVKFLFHNPSLVTNDYYLLHSTCRGEFYNPRWEIELYSKAPWDQQGNTIDGTEMAGGHNRQAKRLFDSM